MSSSSAQVEESPTKARRNSKAEGQAPFRPQKASASKSDTRTARQLKFIQKWGDVLESLKTGDKLSAEEGNKQFDAAIEYIEEVKRDNEKCYLLDIGLPEAMSVVLESQYLVDSFHKKSNELVQTTLTFALDGLSSSSLIGACKLLIDIFQHRFFSSVFSEGILVDPKVQQGGSREFLTTSKRIKTLGRLNDVLHTFSEQKGYQIIREHITVPNQSLNTTYHLLQVVIVMSTYLNTTQSTLIDFIKAAHNRLIGANGTQLNPNDLHLYDEIKDCVNQLILMVNPTELGFLQELFSITTVSKVLSDFSNHQVHFLFMDYPHKNTSVVTVDATNLAKVGDVKREFCRLKNLELDEVAFCAVSTVGIIIKHHDDQHGCLSLAARGSFNVCYQMPSGWKRKYIQVKIVESKPSETFVPFYGYLRRKDLTGKHLYENLIPSAYTWTVKSMSEQPFSLKGFVSAASPAAPFDVSNTPARIFPDAKKGDSVTIRVNWSETARSSPIQANDLLNTKYHHSKTEVIDMLSKLFADPARLVNFYFQSKDKLSEPVKEIKVETSKSVKDGKDKEKRKSSSSKHTLSQIELQTQSYSATISLFDRFFSGLVKFIASFDLDLSYSVMLLIQHFSNDPRLRDMLTNFEVVPSLLKNLQNPDSDIRSLSAKSLTFYGHDTFCFQAPLDSYEMFERRGHKLTDSSSNDSFAVPLHLNHLTADVLQFLYQMNSLRTVDQEFIQHSSNEEMFWFLPVIFQVLKKPKVKREGSFANESLRMTFQQLLEKLKDHSYLRQFTLWLKMSNLIEEKDFDLEWAIGTRFLATAEFFKNLAGTMPATLEVGKTFASLDIMDPMHDSAGHNMPISSVTVKKIFTSKAKPCLLEMRPSDAKLPSNLVIFKKGDDLRQDLLVQICFYIFNILWKHSDLSDKPFIHQYRLIPMGPDIGCVEFVKDCESLNTFDFTKAWPKYTEEDKSLLLRSAAGSYVAGWIMGVRDRHQDNMMIQRSNMFFHIDLGHIFNEKPTIDAPRFAIPPDLKAVMKPEEWDRFKDLCANGFKILHRYAGLLINIICILFDGLADLKKVRPFLASPHSLMVALDEDEAVEKIKGLIESGVSSIWRANKWGIHSMFQKSGDKSQAKADQANADRHAQALLLQAQSESPTISEPGSSTPNNELALSEPIEIGPDSDRSVRDSAGSEPGSGKKRKSQGRRILNKLIGNVTNPNALTSSNSNPTSPRSPAEKSPRKSEDEESSSGDEGEEAAPAASTSELSDSSKPSKKE